MENYEVLAKYLEDHFEEDDLTECEGKRNDFLDEACHIMFFLIHLDIDWDTVLQEYNKNNKL